MSENFSNDTTSNKRIEGTALPSPNVAKTTRTATPTTALATVSDNSSNWKAAINMDTFVKKLDSFSKRLSRGLWRVVMMGIVLHVAEYFAPELRQHITILYQIVDGGMMFMNFTFEWGIRLITAIFTGQFFYINGEFLHAFRELIATFTTWITSI